MGIHAVGDKLGDKLGDVVGVVVGVAVGDTVGVGIGDKLGDTVGVGVPTHTCVAPSKSSPCKSHGEVVKEKMFKGNVYRGVE